MAGWETLRPYPICPIELDAACGNHRTHGAPPRAVMRSGLCVCGKHGQIIWPWVVPAGRSPSGRLLTTARGACAPRRRRPRAVCLPWPDRPLIPCSRAGGRPAPCGTRLLRRPLSLTHAASRTPTVCFFVLDHLWPRHSGYNHVPVQRCCLVRARCKRSRFFGGGDAARAAWGGSGVVTRPLARHASGDPSGHVATRSVCI